MTPAVGGLLPREVLAGGLSIPALALDLPAGIDVGVPIYAIQHHADYVAGPFLFDPSRWLPARPGEEPHAQDRDALLAVFTPFSIGHRACLGKPLVYMELCIAIARLVWEFEMRLSREQHVSPFIEREIRCGKRQPSEYQLQDWFMSRNEGPWAEFKVRHDAN
jgi:cytochrome P450